LANRLEQIVVGGVLRSWRRSVGHGVPIAPEGLAQSSRLPANPVGEAHDESLLARSLKVVDEGRMLGEQGGSGDGERVLEYNDGGELRSEYQVRDGRRGRRRGLLRARRVRFTASAAARQVPCLRALQRRAGGSSGR